MEIGILIAELAVALIVGVVLGRLIFAPAYKGKKEAADREAKTILDEAKLEAENLKKSRILEAKEKFLQLKSEHEAQTNDRNRKMNDREIQLKNREKQIAQQGEQFKKKEMETDVIKQNLTRQLEVIGAKQEELERVKLDHVKKLEAIARITAEEAKAQIVESLREEATSEAMAFIKKEMDEAKMKANREAKKIVIQTIQRTASEHTIENTVSIFNLESDDLKGQIIGREGRNIRAIEAATGVELIVDDTPEAIIISGFDPVRREIARLSLQRLVADGRIHPARIEEVVAKTTKQLEDQVMEIGERTVIELGIHGLNPALVKMVGRMRFRSSYGQNLLQHSKETANLCAVMAAELGMNPNLVKLAKRAGLLHDIGKVPTEESELSHALLGMELCKKYGEHESIVNAVGAHHDEVEMTFVISPIIQSCDAISGARPGARREIMEQYIKRIKDLENLAMGYEGVDKAYAIQAGRELRVIVASEKVTDQRSDELSFEIAQKIQNEMQYPGQIRVTVIREKRAVNVAK